MSWQHSAHGEATWELCDTSTKSPGDPAAFPGTLVVQKLEVPRSVTSRQCCWPLLLTSLSVLAFCCGLFRWDSAGKHELSSHSAAAVSEGATSCDLASDDTSNTAWEGNEIAFAVSHGRATYHGGNPDTTCLVKTVDDDRRDVA